MATLILTVTGPFAFVDNTSWGNPKDGFITLMAPLCAQHKGGIAGIEKGNQYIFDHDHVNCRNHHAKCADCKPWNYQLMIVQTCQNVGGPKPSQILNTVPGKCPDPKEWRFWLTLPRPDTFIEINPVDADIITDDGSKPKGPFAIGLRFIYSKWDGQSVPLSLNGQPALDPSQNPFAFYYKDANLALLDLDYTGPVRDDPDHEDAVDCFETLMNTLGRPWSIYIKPYTVVDGRPPQPATSKLNDCKAAVAYVTTQANSAPREQEEHHGAAE